MIRPYRTLRREIESEPNLDWLLPLLASGAQTLRHGPHGDLPRWHKALEALPDAVPFFEGASAAPVLGGPVEDREGLAELLMALHPWRKGPLNIGGVQIDAEWRSDWKWGRIGPQLDLHGHSVLDVGCGNGYYGWRMLGDGARRVVGVEPTLVYVMQWLACSHFAGDQPNTVLPLALEELPEAAGGFDSVFSMGVLYHRRDAGAHLQRLARLARPGGQVIVETLVLEGEAKRVLTPEGRYARMRNAHTIPSLSQLEAWLSQAGLQDIRLLDLSPTTTREQRSTQWMRFESLAEALDPQDPARTVEGHPAPLRAALLANTRSR